MYKLHCVCVLFIKKEKHALYAYKCTANSVWSATGHINCGMCVWHVSAAWSTLLTLCWLLTKQYSPALCTCSYSPCLNELAVLVNVGHISLPFRHPLSRLWPNLLSLPFDDIFMMYHVLALLIVRFWFLYNFDNKYTFIVIVIDGTILTSNCTREPVPFQYQDFCVTRCILCGVLCYTSIQIFHYRCNSITMVSVGEQRYVNYAEILPFHSLSDYNVENEFLSTRRKFVKLMDNEKNDLLKKIEAIMNV